MTKKKRYKRYSPEFKREALKRASEEGVTDVLVCEELGISARQLLRQCGGREFLWLTETRTRESGTLPNSRRGAGRCVQLHRVFLPSKTPPRLSW